MVVGGGGKAEQKAAGQGGGGKLKAKGKRISGLTIALKYAREKADFHPRAKGHRARGVPIQPNLCVGLWRGGVVRVGGWAVK